MGDLAAGNSIRVISYWLKHDRRVMRDLATGNNIRIFAGRCLCLDLRGEWVVRKLTVALEIFLAAGYVTAPPGYAMKDTI